MPEGCSRFLLLHIHLSVSHKVVDSMPCVSRLHWQASGTTAQRCSCWCDQIAEEAHWTRTSADRIRTPRVEAEVQACTCIAEATTA